jgi:hypothetical protein
MYRTSVYESTGSWEIIHRRSIETTALTSVAGTTEARVLAIRIIATVRELSGELKAEADNR